MKKVKKMNEHNKLKVATEVATGTSIKTELVKGLLVAVSLGAAFFYFILFPFPLTRETLVQPERESGEPLRSNLVYTACTITNSTPAGPVNWGHRKNSEGQNIIAFVQDMGNNQVKLRMAHPETCNQGGFSFTTGNLSEGQSNRIYQPVIGDTDGDGNSEVIVSTQNKVLAYTNTGSLLWSFQPETQYGQINFSQPMLGEWWTTHHGLETLVASRNGTTLYLHRLKGDEPDRGTRIGIPITVANVSTLNAVAIGDVVDDVWHTSPQIIIVSDEPATKDSRIHIFKRDGQLLYSFTAGFSGLTASPPYAPPALLTQDPSDGYIYVGYNVGSNTVIKGWHITPTGPEAIGANFPITVPGNINLQYGHTLVFVNLTGGVRPDLAFVTNNQKLHAYTYDGVLVSGFPITLSHPVSQPTQPIAADTNNDGLEEIHLAFQPCFFETFESGGAKNGDEDGGGLSLTSGDLCQNGETIRHVPTFNVWENLLHLSVPVTVGSEGRIEMFGITGSADERSSWASTGGTNNRQYGYNFCNNITATGDCRDAYGSTSDNVYCNGGAYHDACIMCGCPGGYYCHTYGYCATDNPPPPGGSPAIMKAPQWFLDQMHDWCEDHPNDPLCQGNW